LALRGWVLALLAVGMAVASLSAVASLPAIAPLLAIAPFQEDPLLVWRVEYPFQFVALPW